MKKRHDALAEEILTLRSSYGYEEAANQADEEGAHGASV